MKVVKNVLQMQKIAFKHLQNNDEIGLIPTMGALHDGHVALFSKSKKNDDVTIVSVFVNPIQFGPKEDYLKYPRSIEKDLEICKKNHVDYVFVPSADDIFPQGYKTFAEVKVLQDVLCGLFRPIHFRGVVTIVVKLLNVTYADRAYFGMKDFQQLKIIKKMVEDLNFRTKIIPCSTIREKSGLAISTRNNYLSADEKIASENIFKILKEASQDFKNKDLNSVKRNAVNRFKKIINSKIDYAEIVDFSDLTIASEVTRKTVFVVAIWIGNTRLLDNIMMTK